MPAGAGTQVTSDGGELKPGVAWNNDCTWDDEHQAAAATALCRAAGFNSGRYVSATNDPCTDSYFDSTFDFYYFL